MRLIASAAQLKAGTFFRACLAFCRTVGTCIDTVVQTRPRESRTGTASPTRPGRNSSSSTTVTGLPEGDGFAEQTIYSGLLRLALALPSLFFLLLPRFLYELRFALDQTEGFDNTETNLRALAEREGMVGSYLTRLVRLTFLAPDIITAILAGNHPPELTARKLMRDTRLPLDWTEQRRVLGFI